jgi:hypothetical protein
MTMKRKIGTGILIAFIAFCFLRSGRLCNELSLAKAQCWTRCHDPVSVVTAADISVHLRSTINPRLTLLDRVSGWFTTPIFKMSGIQGWRDYGLIVVADGQVKQIADSLDGMTTVDLKLNRLSPDGQSLEKEDKYLRIEVFGCVRRSLMIEMHEGQRLQVRGKLMWDGDGFLEVHPGTAENIQELQ